MKKKDFWEVACTYVQMYYNDVSYYSIINGEDVKIATSQDRALLEKICSSHNKCFFQDED